MTAHKQHRILLGEIVGVHGIRGDVVIRSYTADPLALGTYGPLQSADGRATFSIENVRLASKKLIARVRGVDDRDGAEHLRGTKLYADRSRLDDPAPGEFYHVDLVGLEAVSIDGEKLGRVVAVENFGAGDLLEIQLAESSKSTEFVPFTDAHVPEVRLDERVVVIVPPVYAAKAGEGESDDEDESL